MIRTGDAARVLAAVLGCLLMAGCSSSGGTHGQKMAQGFAQTKGQLIDGQAQVDTVLAQMDQLKYYGSGNLNNSFKNYRAAVDKLEKQGEDAKWRAQAMDENIDSTIQAWQKEMESVQDPQVKATLEARKEAVRTNYAQVRRYADDARSAYQPFLQDNKDIAKALSMDLSPANVNALAPKMEQAKASGAALKQQLAAMQQALTNIERGMPPGGQAASASR